MTTPVFIGYPAPFCRQHLPEDPAPLFRRHFTVKPELTSAVLEYCPLGLGIGFINGCRLTEDLLLTPTSDYRKTVWYTVHDVTAQLQEGENLLAVALGNGFHNEPLVTPWDTDATPWRDAPKLWLSLVLTYADGETAIITTDDRWLCERERSPYRYNQLRAGEKYDFSYMTDWMRPDLDDSDWHHAVAVEAPAGTLRLCSAPPIRIDRSYDAVELYRNHDGDWVYDFGQNMAGWVRVSTCQPAGTRLHIVYAEQLEENGRRKDHGIADFYKNGETQFEEIVFDGKPAVWEPRFSYYGFRYVIVSGAVEPLHIRDITAKFVHQDMTLHGHFHCSDKVLEKLYRLSRISTLSNLFYMPTDCPTREKMGWTNDAAASAEQMLQNMDMMAFYDKWLQDIVDAVNEEGNLPGVIPTGGWGYEWGNGPISTSVLFEVPYRLYQYTGSKRQLVFAYPAMCRHLAYLETCKDPATGLYADGLTDWAGPFDVDDQTPVPLELTCTAMLVRFFRIAAMAAEAAGDSTGAAAMQAAEAKATADYKAAYILPDGRCAIEKQTALAMTIALGLYDDLAPLKEQFQATLEERDHHFYVGMLGMQFLLPACDICGMQEDGYRLLTATGYPSYRYCFEDDATTMYEFFHCGKDYGGATSLNHHMYTCVIAWFHNTVLGIRRMADALTLQPYFLKGLEYANGSFMLPAGELSMDWRREKDGTVILYITTPQDTVLHLTDYATEDEESTLVLHAGRHMLYAKPCE